MKIAPFIHSRTGQCDYNSKFAVRPNGFSEIQWARSKILAQPEISTELMVFAELLPPKMAFVSRASSAQ